MNRQNIQTAIWLDETVKSLTKLKREADHFSQCQFELGSTLQNEVYANVKNAIDEAIDKINAEFERL